MRIVLTVLAIGVCALSFPGEPIAAPSFADYGAVTAVRSGDKVKIKVAGKGVWNVNTEYNIKVTLGSAVLRKKDATFAGKREGGKAASASFEATDPASGGKVKAVFCDETSCTSPLETAFKVQ